VNKALATLKANGTLQRLQKQYLQAYLSVPTIQP
jgi:ABC-type amino acid transport substrate-binding protein